MRELPAILSLGEIDSTNLEAGRRLEAGERGPLWITAQVQTAGRGRLGRNWETPSGNLAATLLTTTQRPPMEAAQVAFVAALAVADVVGGYADASMVRLKWPNDTLLGGRKVSGVLVESGALPAGEGLWLIVGIGVNLAHAPKFADRPATAIADHLDGSAPSPSDAAHRLAAAFGRWVAIWESQGFAPIAAAWTERAYGLGEICVARLPNETIEGVAEGLDGDGALRLRLADGAVRRITAGDVFF
ncbi:MAG TPA: biotin--[acetyl-CoA-carboxylase] ligase [Caulobacteraceae bacterium]|jgi:BirA family biotin operon repressor/biotin-[acetyl-CoA-carboxylase] ligase|nr:biotin--[acetyl-CoA-carboxylase] ligase [Caulobacteraceae bacterium]